MNRLISVSTIDDISQEYRDTPIGFLLEYHNLNRALDNYTQARLLIGMCMDNRKRLRIPDNFAYVIRSGGANLRYSEFKGLTQMMNKIYTIKSTTLPRCGSTGKFKDVQQRTYSPPMTKPKLISRITRCPSFNEMDGTVSKLRPLMECEEDV